MIKRLFASALFAGLAAGTVAFLLQLSFVTPLILEAELFEQGQRVHFAAAPGAIVQSDAGLDRTAARDIARDLQSYGFALVTFTAFALLLVAAMALSERFGHAMTARQGLIWGLAGFIAVQLAPAMGLPPELPGIVAAEMAARQTWWIGSVLATTAGLALVGFGRGWLVPVIGAALILAPIAVGAPQLATYQGIVPPELSARFVASSLGVAAAGWAVLGLMVAVFWTRTE